MSKRNHGPGPQRNYLFPAFEALPFWQKAIITSTGGVFGAVAWVVIRAIG